MRDRLVRRYRLHIAAFFLKVKKNSYLTFTISLDSAYQFAVVMLTVSAVLDVVQVVTSLLTQQAQLLSTRHVKLLFTSGLITLHARTSCCL